MHNPSPAAGHSHGEKWHSGYIFSEALQASRVLAARIGRTYVPYTLGPLPCILHSKIESDPPPV